MRNILSVFSMCPKHSSMIMGGDACLKCALKTRTLLNCLKWQIDQLKCRRNKQQLLMQNVLPVWELISQVCLWNNITKPPSKSRLNPSWSGPTLSNRRGSEYERRRGSRETPTNLGWVISKQSKNITLTHSNHLAPIGGVNFLFLTSYHRQDPRSEQRNRLTYSLPLRKILGSLDLRDVYMHKLH